MGEILGLGITHQPTLAAAEFRPVAFQRALNDPLLPASLRDPIGWPPDAREAWADDGGLRACEEHRRALAAQFAKVREALDDFHPDFVVIWGDDQYENFKEDIIPPFCVLAYDSFTFPFPSYGGQPNLWGDPPGATMTTPGHRDAAKYLATGLLSQDFDVSFSYKPLHDALGHAFACSILYLDWSRAGFPYPVVPITVNCYGRLVISDEGKATPLRSEGRAAEFYDPPSPSPQRCFAFGAAAARTLLESPWRVALIASSSWSHSFLTSKTHKLVPDTDADQAMFDALQAGKYDVWLDRDLNDIENSGQQEMLNWYCLLGAMAELGRLPSHAVLIKSSIANSNKVMAIYK